MQRFEARVHITLDMIEVGSHGSFLSKGMAAGKGSGLGWAEEEMQEDCCYKSAQIHDGSLTCWTPWFRLID